MFESIALSLGSLFIVGSAWFWILMAIEILCLIGFVGKGRSVAPVVTIIVGVCLLIFMGDFNIFNYIIDNWLKCLGYFVGWALCGVIYAVITFRSKMKKFMALYKKEKSDWLAQNTNKTENDFINNRIYRYAFDYGPKEISFWITYWLPLILWDCIFDYIWRIGDYLYEIFSALFLRMKRYYLKDYYMDIDKRN